MNNNKEIWKPIEGYEGYYMISSWGRVKSLPRVIQRRRKGKLYVKERILRPAPNHDGYVLVELSNNGVSKKYALHRLVAQAFIPNTDNLPEVNHRDEDKTNNHVSNLEWCTRKYNVNYGTCQERRKKKNINGKLSKPVIQATLDGRFAQIWVSAKEAARQTGWDNSGISLCAHGKIPTYKGYVWRYIVND